MYEVLPDARYEPPYEGAKDMLLAENVDDRDFLTALFTAMEPELPEKKKLLPALIFYGDMAIFLQYGLQKTNDR